MYKKKGALSCEKKVKLSSFNFSRRSSDLVVREFLLIQKWVPTIYHSHKKRKGSAVPSLIFTSSGCSLPQKNRKSNKCVTFMLIASADHDSCQLSCILTLPINSLRYFCYICGLFRASFPLCHFQALLNLLLMR